jgi:hypothetical protein
VAAARARLLDLGPSVRDDRQRLSFDLGFAPDADPLAPGVVANCVNFVPTVRGMSTLPAPAFLGSTTGNNGTVFTTQPINSYWARPQSETYEQNVEYASTQDRLYIRTDRFREWSDITAAVKPYPTGFWSIAAFGPVVIGAEGGSVLQRPSPSSAGSGSMYALPTSQNGGEQATIIAGAPTCCIVTSAERFVLAFNGRGGDSDTWNCSARDNHTSWTLSPATLAAQGRLVEPYGPIIAALPMGNDVMVYKATGVIRGRFVPGDAEVWKWQKLPVRIGAASPRAVCALPDGRHAVMNSESCWLFDGVQSVDVLTGRARSWYQSVARNISYQYGGMAVAYDGSTESVWFSFKANENTITATSAVVYHVPTGKLGYVVLPADLIVETADVGFNSTVRSVGYFESSTHRMLYLPMPPGTQGSTITNANSGAGENVPVQCYLLTGDTGDPFDLIDVTGIKPDLLVGQDSASTVRVELFSRDIRNSVNYSIYGSKVAAHVPNGDRYALRASAHWHRVAIYPTGNAMELSGMWLRAARTKSERGG